MIQDLTSPLITHRHTILELLGFKTIPIINTNDVVVSPSEPDSVYEKQLAPENKEHVSHRLSLSSFCSSLPS